MQRQKRRDTGCEMAVRRLLHTQGIRYRVDFRPLSDEKFRVDIGWKARKIAVFIDGCFWHACPQHGTTPRSNTKWWTEKLSQNKQRDVRIVEQLEAGAWKVLRFWEQKLAEHVTDKIIAHVSALRRTC